MSVHSGDNRGVRLAGVDAPTFRVLDAHYAIDQRRAYAHVLDALQPPLPGERALEAIPIGAFEGDPGSVSWRAFPTAGALVALDGADLPSFRVLDAGFAVDRSHLYFAFLDTGPYRLEVLRFPDATRGTFAPDVASIALRRTWTDADGFHATLVDDRAVYQLHLTEVQGVGCVHVEQTVYDSTRGSPAGENHPLAGDDDLPF